MGKADLHIHSIHSWDGTCTIAGILKQASQTAKLDVIAVTDHDTMAGVQTALDLAPDYGIEVIPGMEVSSADGHILCLFINDPIPAGLSFSETAGLVAEQGGICIVAHPTERGPFLVDEHKLARALENPVVASTLVGMEAFNACLNYQPYNQTARAMVLRRRLALIGDSDAHVAWMIGRGATFFPGRRAKDLRKAILNRQTRVVVTRSLTIQVILSWHLRIQLRRLGWVSHNASPDLPLRLTRAVSV